MNPVLKPCQHRLSLSHFQRTKMSPDQRRLRCLLGRFLLGQVRSLSTTQRYLGKITDTEAMRWIENLYA